jgi:hypothetical protein
MLSARTVFEENFDNDEAFGCSAPRWATSAPSWPGMAPTTRRTTSLSTPDGYDH